MAKVLRKLTDGEKDETIYRVTRTDFEESLSRRHKTHFLYLPMAIKQKNTAMQNWKKVK